MKHSGFLGRMIIQLSILMVVMIIVVGVALMLRETEEQEIKENYAFCGVVDIKESQYPEMKLGKKLFGQCSLS